jgi:hypothetical protein
VNRCPWLSVRLRYSAVESLSVSAADKQVTVTWTDPDSERVDDIDVVWAPEDGQRQLREIDPGTQQAQITGLRNGTTYVFAVRTVGAE